MPNQLIRETSPYLLQHADNPVDWHPWGDEALQRAREQDKPILLSIGYSACHWCHVMAHESFEDVEVAEVMNRLFVNIKVDREERPDLDQIYQSAHYMLTQRSGGWPLTMFLTPDQKPFFGGTYFPKAARFNLPAFKDLLERVAFIYREQRAELEGQNQRLMSIFARSLPEMRAAPAKLDHHPLGSALHALNNIFDSRNGGLGNAPKFPHPAELEFCLRRYAATGDETALEIPRLTLTRMAEGGIYDQLGGGFARYSVDPFWSIPHFEKMLYDNGPLLKLAADLWLVARDPLFERVARETAAWAMREMQSPEGGYYSTIDADSEHEEGKFYVWTPEEVARVLSEAEYAVAAPHYGLDGPPNFEGKYWHLRIAKPLPEVAQSLGLEVALCEQQLVNAKAKLFAVREKRVRPGRDEKVLASWNALMIRGMAHAGRVFGQAEWIESAARAAEFIRTRMWGGERLSTVFKDGQARFNGYLDDYAFLLNALLTLMQAEFRKSDLDFAVQLAEVLLAQFEDAQAGGFFFTSHDHEKLIHRPKSGHDNATPSGNGIAAFAMQRLGHVLGESRYLEAAERALKLFSPQLAHQPSAFVSFCLG
ncbi:MAG TPA: thioredoxin domain-containing protein, partial [Burkholderiales bacterium]|nr:thioredoxin domain-containing protein [Burkholderiales bacterium]